MLKLVKTKNNAEKFGGKGKNTTFAVFYQSSTLIQSKKP